MNDKSARSPQVHRRRPWQSSLVALSLLSCAATAEIFRYQDDRGNWHFTDKPPNSYESSIVPGIATSKTSTRDPGPSRDLASHLQSIFDPITPIAYATMAVVSIKSNSIEGSGFFCTEEGHILTNKHLVRPALEHAITGRKTTVREWEKRLQALEASARQARARLPLMKQDLSGYEKLIEDTRGGKTRSWAQGAQKRLAERYDEGRHKSSALESKIRSLKTELRDMKRDLALKRDLSRTKTRFDIVLKDGTELVATLVKISETQDLALLKLDGFRTPYLRIDPSPALPQGLRVFAIGNPLGMQAAVSSGVITQIAPDHLYTDAQILPGSSGGPLIRESGEVIGINVARRVAAGASKYSSGFGKTIPASLAVREFSRFLGPALEADFGLPQKMTTDPYWGTTFGTGEAEEVGPDTPAGLHPREAGGSGSGPARLIVPGKNDGHLANDTSGEPGARSLDFPPEGTGLPPGISFPRD